MDKLRHEVAELKQQLHEIQQARAAATAASRPKHGTSTTPAPPAQPAKATPARPTVEGVRPSKDKAQEERIRELIEELGSRSIVRQYQSAMELRRIGEPAVPFLIQALAEEEDRGRRAAAIVLSKMRAKSAVPALVQALRKAPDPSEKLIYVGALGKLRDGRAVPALLEELECKDWRVQAACARALGRAEDGKAVPALTSLLESKNEHVRGSAIHALKKIGADGIPALSKAFASAPGPTKVHILTVLEKIGGKGSIAEIQKALNDANMYVRLAAARSLARLGRRDGLAAANEALKSPSAKTRDFGMEVIRSLGDAVRYDPHGRVYVPKQEK